MIAEVRPWARTRLNALGYREHSDGFNFLNVASTALEDVYHIELGEVSEIKNTVDILECQVPFNVRLFLRGGSDPKTKIDSAAALADRLIAAFLAPQTRLRGEVIKNVQFSSCRIEPAADSNDNSIILRTAWMATVAMGMRMGE